VTQLSEADWAHRRTPPDRHAVRPSGRRITNELITAPAAIEQAVTWRDLALRHSVDDVGR
jgi:hypothetical protein